MDLSDLREWAVLMYVIAAVGNFVQWTYFIFWADNGAKVFRFQVLTLLWLILLAVQMK